jgi:hypothetical protein
VSIDELTVCHFIELFTLSYKAEHLAFPPLVDTRLSIFLVSGRLIFVSLSMNYLWCFVSLCVAFRDVQEYFTSVKVINTSSRYFEFMTPLHRCNILVIHQYEQRGLYRIENNVVSLTDKGLNECRKSIHDWD